MRLDQRVAVEEARILPVEYLGAEIAANMVIDRVAEDGCAREHTHQHEDVHPALAQRRQRPSHEKQRVAGQERRHDETGFGKDDDEQDAVDPQPVLLHQKREMLVEVQHDVDELGQDFHVGRQA